MFNESSTTDRVIHHIRLVPPHGVQAPSLQFDPISQTLEEGGPPVRLGRVIWSEEHMPRKANMILFNSKVVSRVHAEIWAEEGGRFFVKDAKSSSGTFLNGVRLSPANTESRPYEIKDGDELQLGVSYQGGKEDIYKSVKMLIEFDGKGPAAVQSFDDNMLKNLEFTKTARL